jgi:hypothetical protein
LRDDNNNNINNNLILNILRACYLATYYNDFLNYIILEITCFLKIKIVEYNLYSLEIYFQMYYWNHNIMNNYLISATTVQYYHTCI